MATIPTLTGDHWRDVDQDGLPPHLATVWVHHEQPTTRLAILGDDEVWYDAFDHRVKLSGIVAWRPFRNPPVPVRAVTWAGGD